MSYIYGDEGGYFGGDNWSSLFILSYGIYTRIYIFIYMGRASPMMMIMILFPMPHVISNTCVLYIYIAFYRYFIIIYVYMMLSKGQKGIWISTICILS